MCVIDWQEKLQWVITDYDTNNIEVKIFRVIDKLTDVNMTITKDDEENEINIALRWYMKSSFNTMNSIPDADED
jgi:DNA recombination-dependent growth factor C